LSTQPWFSALTSAAATCWIAAEFFVMSLETSSGVETVNWRASSSVTMRVRACLRLSMTTVKMSSRMYLISF